MANQNNPLINSPLGERTMDSSGSPLGVVRLDCNKSYAGISELLANYINNSSQDSWDRITAKIDYTYESIDYALTPLEKETKFITEIKKRLEKGQKLLFKPNIVNPMNIDPLTHGPLQGSLTCVNWTFIASLMRWFHDKAGVSYHQMMFGEAATMSTATATFFSRTNPDGKVITTEAVYEGKSGNFYGGWGFYFVRKYLAESMKDGEIDNPLNGYEESINGTYIPPGFVNDKLMVYDLNRIYDDPNKGRECEVPDGINYKSIGLHKVIIGGDPNDLEDMKAYPGCILINVPKFKVHAITLLTNVIKNLGIGLYPMQYAKNGDFKWDYASPHDTEVVGMKAGIPHQVWVPEINPKTLLPKRDAEGNYILQKTGGIVATMLDIIKATSNQNIFMIHIVDGIEAINLDHMGNGVITSEGIVFAGLDPVATDTLSARYMFSNVHLKESLEVKLDNGTAGGFPQKVPIPVWDGTNIITESGYDCPLSRDITFKNAEKRGLGQRIYHARGYDFKTDAPIVSLKGHLGSVKDDNFLDIITNTLFYDSHKVPWDLQKTALAYMSVMDKITGSNLKEEFIKCHDENEDDVITYEEFGKKGSISLYLHAGGEYASTMASKEYGNLIGHFKMMSTFYKFSNKSYNSEQHEIMKEFFIGTSCSVALTISQLEIEIPDPFRPGLTCGKGKWPTLQFAQYYQLGVLLYGLGFPFSMGIPSLYSDSLFHADLTQNGGQYYDDSISQQVPESILRYLGEVADGKTKPLDFKFYIPAGFESFSGKIIPNVEITDDPSKLFTASFQNDTEIWP